MRAGWEAIGAVLLLLFSTALAPGAIASGGEDCTEVRYALTPEASGTIGTCQDPAEVPWDIWPENPGGPGLPGYDQDAEACEPGYGSYYATETGQRALVCFSAEVFLPGAIGLPGVPGLPGPGEGDTRPCPEDQDGEIRENDWYVFGICTIVIVEAPEHTEGVYISPRITPDHCELSDGPGVDPSISINGGGVVFCVFVHLEIKHGPEVGVPPIDGTPELEVDLEPCRPEAVDPAVFIGDAGVRVCVWGNVDTGIL